MGIEQRHQLPATQSLVAPRHLVEAVGKGEAVPLPGEQAQPIADRMQQHARVLQARQIRITREVLDQLPDPHRSPPPERDPVQLHLESRRGEAGQVQLIGAQLLAGPRRQGIGPGEPQRLPGADCGVSCTGTSSHWWVSGSRAVTVPSAALRWVSAWVAWWGVRLRFMLEGLLDLEALSAADAAVDDDHGILAAEQGGDVALQVVQGVAVLGEDDQLLLR